MAAFPLLRTGAITQYPSTRTVTYSTGIARYLDGAEQRFRLYAKPVVRWQVRLSAVSPEELSALERFFREMQGRYSSFVFIDPWTGVEYPNCSFDDDAMEARVESLFRASGSIGIRNNTA
ncbi:MAG TPA: DUF2460 domain-containing protein [Bryobacteraceae bacterium]|nr:DUF2460 domain-containing protein [Bryobacteraceae bacterium]